MNNFEADKKLFDDACLSNDISTVCKLLEKYYHQRYECSDYGNCKRCCYYSRISIEYLFKKKYINIIKCLIRKHKSLIYKTFEVNRNLYSMCCYYGYFELVKLINSVDKNINKIINDFGETSLMTSMYSDNLELIKYLAKKVDINAQDYNGSTALTYAYNNYSYNSKFFNEKIKILMDNNCDLYIKNVYDFTIFSIVIRNKVYNTIKFFLKEGYVDELLKESIKLKCDDVYSYINNFIKEENEKKKIKSSNIFSLIVLLNDDYYKFEKQQIHKRLKEFSKIEFKPNFNIRVDSG